MVFSDLLAEKGKALEEELGEKVAFKEPSGPRITDRRETGQLFQLFHVMRKRWRSDFEASPHGFAGQWWSGAADPLDDLLPTRVGQRFRDVLHLIL